MKSISVNRYLAKIIFYFIKNIDDNKIVLVCKGYDEDDDNYTGIYWPDDKDLFFSDETYFDFQIWYSTKKSKSSS